MKREFRGFTKIFSFSLGQHVRGKGYRSITVLVGLLCLVVPALIMVLSARSDVETESVASAYEPGSVSHVLVVDTTLPQVDYEVLNSVGSPDFANVTYTSVQSLEEAADMAESSEDTLILIAEQLQAGRMLHVLLPEGSTLTEDDAAYYQQFLNASYSAVLVEKSGFSSEQLAGLMTPVQSQVTVAHGTEGEAAADGLSAVREILSILLPYLVIMVLYFMILAYGQGVANCVLMEKTSKLVDTFLVTVRPGAMMLGKVLAIALSGVMQLFCWIFCLVVSFFAGTALVKLLAPGADLALIQLFDLFGEMSGLFTPGGILLAVLVFLSGFLMYCALAAIGGAMASKPEDLSNTNVLFTMALIISFFSVLFGSSMVGSDGYTWQIFVPFTAMLIVPSMALLGEISIPVCCISLSIMLITTLLIIYLAGKVYRLLILRKGDPLSPGKLLKLLRGKPVES